jgi:hypothetical protein
MQRDERDTDAREGVGAFGWLVLSTLLMIGMAVGAWTAYAMH